MASTSTDVYSAASSEKRIDRALPALQDRRERAAGGGVSSEGLDAVGALSRLLNLGSGYSCNGQNGCNGFSYDEMFFEVAPGARRRRC